MKLLRMNLLCLLLLFGVFTSVSYASIDYSKLTEFNYTGSVSDFADYVIQLAFGDDVTFDYIYNHFAGNSATVTQSQSRLTNLRNNLISANSVYYAVFTQGSSNTPHVKFFVGTGNSVYNMWVHDIDRNVNSGLYYYSAEDSSSRNLPYTNGNYKNLNGWLWDRQNFYFANVNTSPNPSNSLKFSTTGYSSGNISVSGSSFLRYQKSRSINQWDLGVFDNISYQSVIYCSVLRYNSDNTFTEIARINYYVDWDSSLQQNGLYLNNNVLSIDNSYIYYYQGYRLSISYDGKNGQNNGVIEPFDIYFLPFNDNSSSGDLINDDTDNNNDLPIIQNDNKNNDWWRDTYNNLFTLSSGDVGDIANTIIAYFPLSSGDSPISVYDMIMGSINNEPDDFIIRWDDVDMNMTFSNGQQSVSGEYIKSGSINFSKLTRDNATFGLVHFWIRTLAVISFYIIFIFSLYRCILRIFGVASDDIVPTEEEHRQIGFVNDWRDK